MGAQAVRENDIREFEPKEMILDKPVEDYYGIEFNVAFHASGSRKFMIVVSNIIENTGDDWLITTMPWNGYGVAIRDFKRGSNKFLVDIVASSNPGVYNAFPFEIFELNGIENDDSIRQKYEQVVIDIKQDDNGVMMKSVQSVE